MKKVLNAMNIWMIQDEGHWYIGFEHRIGNMWVSCGTMHKHGYSTKANAIYAAENLCKKLGINLERSIKVF